MDLAGHDVASYALAVGVMTLGCACQAALGTGLALLVVPILALTDPGFVPGPMLLAGSTLAAVMAYRERGAIDRKGLGFSLVGLAIGTALGAFALRFASGPDLRRVFGALIVLAVLLSILAPQVTTSNRNLAVGGLTSGVMGTMVGIHGPAITLVFQSCEPRFARSMLGAFFVVAYLMTVGALTLFGLFGVDELGRTLILLPGVALGLALAPSLRGVVDRRRLRLAILITAAVSGGLLLVK